LEERSHQNLSIQFSLNRRITSRPNSSNPLPMATATGDSSCLSGLDSRVCYLMRRGSRTKRGVRADSPAWSEPPNRTPVAWAGMRKRHLTAVCNGYTSGWEQESARGSDLSETVGIFKSCQVSPLLIERRLSQDFCDSRQEGEAYGKTPLAHPFCVLFFPLYVRHIVFTDPQRSPQRLTSEVCQTEEA